MRCEEKIKVAGYEVAWDDDVCALPCLGGSDVNRHPDVLEVSAVDGRLVWPADGSPLAVEEGTTLRGWGTLDGPSYDVGPADRRWRVAVPRELLDAVRAMLGVDG